MTILAVPAAFFGTSSAKKGKGKRSKAAGSGQAAPADQKLNHSLDMINAFTTLKVLLWPLICLEKTMSVAEPTTLLAWFLCSFDPQGPTCFTFLRCSNKICAAIPTKATILMRPQVL